MKWKVIQLCVKQTPASDFQLPTCASGTWVYSAYLQSRGIYDQWPEEFLPLSIEFQGLYTTVTAYHTWGTVIEASQHSVSLRIAQQLLLQTGYFALTICSETHSPSVPSICPRQQRYTLTYWSCHNWPDKHLRAWAMLPARKYSLSHFLRAFGSGPVSSDSLNFPVLLHNTASTRQLAQPGSRDNYITCYFGRDKRLLKKNKNSRRLQQKGTHQNTTPQDGDTYPYNTESDANVQTYVSIIEHECKKPTMERRTTQRTTRKMQNN